MHTDPGTPEFAPDRGLSDSPPSMVTSLGVKILHRPQIDSEWQCADAFVVGAEDLRYEKVSVGWPRMEVRKTVSADGKVQKAHRSPPDRFHENCLSFSHLTAFSGGLQSEGESPVVYGAWPGSRWPGP